MQPTAAFCGFGFSVPSLRVAPADSEMLSTCTTTSAPSWKHVTPPKGAVTVAWDTDYCLWPRTLRIAIMSVILELPFATSPAMSSSPNFRVLIVAP
nr:MAG TPA: hypothetical protein [Caudoviricetes sp.]